MTTDPTPRRRAALRRAAAAALLALATTGASAALVAPAASAAVPLGSYRCMFTFGAGQWLGSTQEDFDACRASGGDPVWVPDPDSGPVRPAEFLPA